MHFKHTRIFVVNRLHNDGEVLLTRREHMKHLNKGQYAIFTIMEVTWTT